MTTKPDDLEAVRTIADTLEPFEDAERDRILRWARERLGMQQAAAAPVPSGGTPIPPILPTTVHQQEITQDISSFVASKAPASDVHFAATVAYYYQFEAPPAERKDAITKEDLVDACRKVSRKRPKTPAQVLVDAYHTGLLDRRERGQYRLNSVGENLVAMVLPGGGRSTADSQGVRPRKPASRKSDSAPKSGHRAQRAQRD
jgi:hypothetical protein